VEVKQGLFQSTCKNVSGWIIHVLSPNENIHEVVNNVAEGDIGVASYLEFSEPSVISEASIAEPVDQIVGAAFLWDKSYHNARLEKVEISIIIECRGHSVGRGN
jgi:hypothetical protein